MLGNYTAYANYIIALRAELRDAKDAADNVTRQLLRSTSEAVQLAGQVAALRSALEWAQTRIRYRVENNGGSSGTLAGDLATLEKIDATLANTAKVAEGRDEALRAEGREEILRLIDDTIDLARLKKQSIVDVK